jgi:hypothetical protein
MRTNKRRPIPTPSTPPEQPGLPLAESEVPCSVCRGRGHIFTDVERAVLSGRLLRDGSQ